MTAKSHSFSTSSEVDTLFVESLKLQERRAGRANFSHVVLIALKDYAEKVADEAVLLAQLRAERRAGNE